MRSSSRLQQQISNQSYSEPGQRLQTQASFQQPRGHGFILLLLYGVLLLILVILIISIIAICQNSDQQQIVYLGILLILLLTILFGCTMYITSQFQEIQTNNVRMHNEIQMNSWVYSQTKYLLFQYTTQSKFTLIRLTYLYCIFAIFFLAKNITKKTYYECYDKTHDRYYETDHLDENQYYDNCTRNKIPAKFQGPMLPELGILCQIVFSIFIIYEVVKILQKIYLACTQNAWHSYQHDTVNTSKDTLYSLDIPQVILQTKVFCGIFLINNLGKFIALLVIILLTPNTTSYILISSNLFYHFFMIIFTISLLYFIVKQNSYQQNNNLQFIDYQILIDSILRRSNQQNLLFKLFLTISLIFTIVGISEYYNEMETAAIIINYDIFVEYDCGITQLILLGLMLIRYLIIPFCTNQYPRNLTQINQEVLLQNGQNQQINTQQQQSQQRVNVNPVNNVVNNNIQNNPSQSKKLLPIQNIYKNFVFKVELKEKTDCTICLQQLIQNSEQNPIVQLKCHVSHIFHQKCIQDWLAQIKKCPICNTEFS